MNMGLRPFSFLAGHEVLNTALADWTLDESLPDGGPRSFRFAVRFREPFGAAPLVHVGIAGFDIGNTDAARVTVTAERVTKTGFDIVVSTWLHSRLWRVDLNWLALGS
jgi:hypothetical protein